MEEPPAKEQENRIKRAWKKIIRRHFEGREEKNIDLPQDPTEAEDEGFKLDEKDLFHERFGKDEVDKYVHPDGREVIFDKKNREIIRDYRRGTYNYADHTRGIGGAIKHTVYDILPHLLLGTDRGGFLFFP